jgi:serine protease Do
MVLRRTAIVSLVLAGVIQSAAADESPRRPRAALWSAETAGWVAGAGQSVKRPDNEKPEPPISILPSSSSSEKYSYGTAYAAGPDGLWLTARHVIDHCRAIIVEGGSVLTQLMVIEISAHERADVALIRTSALGRSPQPLPLAAKNEDTAVGYEIGFPQGRPAAYASRNIGNTRARRIGTHPSENDSQVWAIVSRVGASESDLEGLAGSPVLDKTGRAVGVVVGESARRGRLVSALPEAAWEVVQGVRDANISASRGGPADLTFETYPEVAQDLVTNRRVARLVCEEKRDAANHGHR